MKISEVPTTELRRIALATEQAVGPEAPEVRAIRRELERRQQNSRQCSRNSGGEGGVDAR